MGWMLSGETILANIETRMVFNGWITYWTDNKSRSLMIVKDPLTGNEDRMELVHPRPWWVIQQQMQIIEEMYGGTPMLEVEHRDVSNRCSKCDGTGGGYDHEGNWITCPECRR